MADLSPALREHDDEDEQAPAADPAVAVAELDDPTLPDPSGADPASASAIETHAGLKDDDDA
jgi:hypothetical protein